MKDLNLKDINLTAEEKATLLLRKLYQEKGFKKFNMARFEEYGFYASNRDFLTGDKVLTFTDLDGRLLALKPDITLSIIKYTKGSEEEKLYYVENVYREDKGSNNFTEVSQVGLEYIGNIGAPEISEVLDMAAISLELIDDEYILEVSNMDFADSILKSMGMEYEDYAHMLTLIRQKNIDGIRKLGNRIGLVQEDVERVAKIPKLYGPIEDVMGSARKICKEQAQEEYLNSFARVLKELKRKNSKGKVQLDFSIINDIGYYNGVIFKGYVKGMSETILSGGQYDKAMKKFGRKEGGIGFALYLDGLGRMKEDEGPGSSGREKEMLNIALPKGRLADEVHGMLQKSGYSCPEYSDKDRRLIFENPEAGVRYLLVKPSDVAVYVEHNAADIGIVGKDILMENNPDVYELLDLGIGRCKMCVAAPKEYIDNQETTLQVATKYVNVAKKYYGRKNRDIEIIKLNGSIELGPILGLTDVIVDIVETGKTLKDNDLEVVEAFKDISARVIASKHGFKFKNKEITKLVQNLRDIQ